MSVGVVRAARVLWPHDLRLVWRGGALLVMLTVGVPVLIISARWFLPYIDGLVAPWFDLEPYYPLVVANLLIGTQPANLGMVIGLLFLDERDQGTLLALQASPLSLRTFLASRVVAMMALNALMTVVALQCVGVVSVPIHEALAATAVASLAVPLVAFFFAVFVRNKVQAVNVLKPFQIWGGIPVALYFAPTPWEWVGSLVMPMYYPMRFFWSSAEGEAEWGVLLVGLVVLGALVVWLVRRLERSVLG